MCRHSAKGGICVMQPYEGEQVVGTVRCFLSRMQEQKSPSSQMNFGEHEAGANKIAVDSSTLDKMMDARSGYQL